MAGLGKQTRGSGLAKVQRQEFGGGGSGRAYVPIDNDTILEQLYEKYLDEGYSPAEAEKKAKKEFDDKAK